MNKEAVSGATAGFAATITFTHPLDVIKTRLQVQDLQIATKYNGTLHAFKTILRNEGARGLYAATFTGSGREHGIVGDVFRVLRSSAETGTREKRRTTTARLRRKKKKEKKSISSGETLLAAAEAGVCVSLLTNPIWVAKTRLALQERGGGGGMEAKISSSGSSGSSGGGAGGGGVKVQKPTKVVVRYKGLIDCLYSIARTEGVPGLYKGLTPSLLLVSHGAIQFTCYENLKSLARGEGGAIFAPENGGKKNNDGIAPTSEQRELTSAECGVYGMLSKIVASLITYPQQVVRRSNAKTSNRTKPD